MWIPPDWMVWTYIGLLCLLTAASFVIVEADSKRDDIHITDLLSLAAVFILLFDWLNEDVTRPALSIFLLLMIYTLANLDALVRAVRSETFESQYEAQDTFVFTASFVLFLSAPLYYLGTVMMVHQ